MLQKTPDIKDFTNILKRHSLKATRQRVAVHEAMMNLGHASADMVAEEIARNSDVKITTASVYNILSSLSLLGVYARRMSSNNKMYFDINTYQHIHMYDCENNSYKDVLDEELALSVEELLKHKKFRGYSVESVDIQFVVRPTRKKTKRA